MNRFIASATALVLTLLMAGEASAFKFSPFRAQFEPSGTAANRTFLVENNTDQPATVQVSLLRRTIDVDGNETHSDAGADFVVYPRQMVLEPGAQRSVRVQWAGGARLGEERAYRILAEQLPVDLDREPAPGGVVRFLVSYSGAVFVTPRSLKQEVSLASFQPVENEQGRFLELLFDNRGGRHAVLDRLSLDLGNGLVLGGEEQLRGVLGETLPARQQRRLLLPWPAGLDAAPRRIQFTYDKRAF